MEDDRNTGTATATATATTDKIRVKPLSVVTIALLKP